MVTAAEAGNTLGALFVNIHVTRWKQKRINSVKVRVETMLITRWSYQKHRNCRNNMLTNYLRGIYWGLQKCFIPEESSATPNINARNWWKWFLLALCTRGKKRNWIFWLKLFYERRDVVLLDLCSGHILLILLMFCKQSEGQTGCSTPLQHCSYSGLSLVSAGSTRASDWLRYHHLNSHHPPKMHLCSFRKVVFPM